MAFDSAKHPRGLHGRFGVKTTGKSAAEARDIASRGMKRHWYNMASMQTAFYGSRRSKRATSVERFKPGLYLRDNGQHEEVLVHQRFRGGRQGPEQPHPRGGTYRPLLREAGWKQTGIRSRKARNIMGGK